MCNAMEFAIKLCVFALYFLYLLDVTEAQKQCKVPNGDAGTCINIEKCKPLMDLHKKKHKTPHEIMYYQQSFCGTLSAVKLKVCCPSQSLWNRFEAKPVLYPHKRPLQSSLSPTPITNSPLFTNSKSPTPAPASSEVPITVVPLSIPPSDVTQIRIAPEEEEKEEEEIRRKCGRDSSSANKIMGGTAVEIDQYAWLALLQYSGEVLGCGGSLISPRFVLTAAHCIKGFNGPPLYVRLAEYNTSSYPTDYVEVAGGGIDSITVDIVEVKSTEIHTQFNYGQKIHDIGLVELMRNANLSSDFIKLICLPERNFIPEFSTSTNFTVAGWGSTGKGDSDIKLEVYVPYVPWDKCEKVQDSDVLDTQICAGGQEGKDSCSGDSGGPLMYVYNDRFYVVGIISYGARVCGSDGKPATHTNVFKYITWIKETMRSKTNK